MREGMRRWLIRGAWATGLCCGAMLLGLRLGRPIWYSDGAREHSASELAAAGMLQWPTPEAEVELPGPVQGRVAMLPDGKLIYGRTQADGTTDLVVFDPSRPGLAPEPAYGLDTPSHELAPAVAADGTVYFASDRPGGSGGFDLYRSHWQNGGFTPPEPLPLCNTARDETDPAPAPGTDELLFVRVDPNVRGGDHGVLLRAHLNGDTDPEPVFADVAARRPEAQPVDRDPVFARDGGAVWFVRREPGRPAALLRASRLGDA
ncbi:MAG TPA: hypothetical protein VFA35_09355, partial [Burkholderiaceae bacterium]|nr:hypothetical protein [Burkholderiaceae bacterium]